MKTVEAMKAGKSLIRSGARSATRTGKIKPTEARSGRLAEPVVCERCGAVFQGRTWRRASPDRPKGAAIAGIDWRTCPACDQVDHEEYLGRVILRGPFARGQEAAIRRRVRNVAARAEFTQPQRRIVSIEAGTNRLEILTTSQKLAHRLGHELEKAFGGRARYSWSDDGSLEASWTPEPEPKTKAAARKPARAAAGKSAAAKKPAKRVKPAAKASKKPAARGKAVRRAKSS